MTNPDGRAKLDPMRAKNLSLWVALAVPAFVVSYSTWEARAETAEDSAEIRRAADEVPDADKPSRADAAVSRMKALLSKVLGHLSDAREARDVVKLNCVNEKLGNIKGLLRVSELAAVALQEAIARRDTSVSNHEFEKIMISLNKSENIATESEACVGEHSVYSGDTEVETEVTNDANQSQETNAMGAQAAADTSDAVTQENLNNTENSSTDSTSNTTGGGASGSTSNSSIPSRDSDATPYL